MSVKSLPGWFDEKAPNPNGRWGRKTDLIESMKNLPTRTGDGGGKLNDRIRGSLTGWRGQVHPTRDELQAKGFVPCRGEDASDARR